VQLLTSRTLPITPNIIDSSQLIKALCEATPPLLQDAIALLEWIRVNLPEERPDEPLFLILVNGCAKAVSPMAGRQLHQLIRLEESQHEGFTSRLDSSLVDMYGKCGLIDEAWSVFCEARYKQHTQHGESTIGLWTAMIHAFGQNGQALRALKLLDEMDTSGPKPNDITLVAALNACSHRGLVDEARALFESMESRWGIKPDTRHETCMVDALGRAGRLEEAEEFIQRHMAAPNGATWSSLLSACRIWR